MSVRRYTSPDEDSARWGRVELREGDVVVSTRSKHGTTWMQTILLLLIHQQPDMPAPLAVLSPWVDHLVEPIDDVVSRIEAQQHRRVLKTHTPLDGIPLHPRVTYIVVARHPLDAAVSLYPRETTWTANGSPCSPAPISRRALRCRSANGCSGGSTKTPTPSRTSTRLLG